MLKVVVQDREQCTQPTNQTLVTFLCTSTQAKLLLPLQQLHCRRLISFYTVLQYSQQKVLEASTAFYVFLHFETNQHLAVYKLIAEQLVIQQRGHRGEVALDQRTCWSGLNSSKEGLLQNLVEHIFVVLGTGQFILEETLQSTASEAGVNIR